MNASACASQTPLAPATFPGAVDEGTQLFGVGLVLCHLSVALCARHEVLGVLRTRAQKRVVFRVTQGLQHEHLQY